MSYGNNHDEMAATKHNCPLPPPPPPTKVESLDHYKRVSSTDKVPSFQATQKSFSNWTNCLVKRWAFVCARARARALQTKIGWSDQVLGSLEPMKNEWMDRRSQWGKEEEDFENDSTGKQNKKEEEVEQATPRKCWTMLSIFPPWKMKRKSTFFLIEQKSCKSLTHTHSWTTHTQKVNKFVNERTNEKRHQHPQREAHRDPSANDAELAGSLDLLSRIRIFP